MDGTQARLYLRVYQSLVGAAYIQSKGGERTYALLRAWSFYARPLVDVVWDEESDPIAVETAHQLFGWLIWLRGLPDPETFFRNIHSDREPASATEVPNHRAQR